MHTPHDVKWHNERQAEFLDPRASYVPREAGGLVEPHG